MSVYTEHDEEVTGRSDERPSWNNAS